MRTIKLANQPLFRSHFPCDIQSSCPVSAVSISECIADAMCAKALVILASLYSIDDRKMTSGHKRSLSIALYANLGKRLSGLVAMYVCVCGERIGRQ